MNLHYSDTAINWTQHYSETAINWTQHYSDTAINHTPMGPRSKEGNVLFNNILNTFYLQLFGVHHMEKDYSDSDKRKSVVTTL